MPVAQRLPTLPGSPIIIGDGEHLLRKYHAVRLRSRRRGEGSLYVTDARVVFYARAQGRGPRGYSALIQETKLEDVTGVSAFVSRRTSGIVIFLDLLLLLSTLIALFSHKTTAAAIFAVLFVAVLLIIVTGLADRSRAGVHIYARGTYASPITFGKFHNHRNAMDTILSFIVNPLLVFARSKSVFDVLFGRPGDDSDRLIAELGALILDLQSRGILAAPHWGVTIEEETSARSQVPG